MSHLKAALIITAHCYNCVVLATMQQQSLWHLVTFYVMLVCGRTGYRHALFQ